MFAGVGFHSGSAGVIIRGQRSILLMACPSTMSTNMPRAASGTRVSASSTLSAAEARRQHRHRNRHSNRHSNSHSNGYSYCDGSTKVFSNTKASPDATAAPVSRRAGGTEIGGRGPRIYAY